MKRSRDDFTEPVKKKLKERVGNLCSKPDCRTLTTGSHTDKMKSTSIGEAAHITAASAGGPRYNSELTTKQRKDISNGIWLCSHCSTIIDKHPNIYTTEILKEWKEETENYTLDVMDGKITHTPPVILKTLENKIKELEEKSHITHKYSIDLYTKDKDGNYFYSRNTINDTRGKVAKYIYDNEVDFFTTENILIAEILNILPETLNRVIKIFKRKNIINIKNRTINKSELEKDFEELIKAIGLVG